MPHDRVCCPTCHLPLRPGEWCPVCPPEDWPDDDDEGNYE